MNLRRLAVQGVFWTGLAYLFRFGFQIVVGAILAHLLTPRDFGLLAMANILVGFLAIIDDFGLGPALVRQPDLDRRHLTAAFAFTVLLGLLLSLALAASAPLMAMFFDEPRLLMVVLVLSPVLFITSLGVVQGAIAQRDLRFKALASRQMAAQVLGAVTGVTMAFLGYGVYALVAQALVAATASTVLVWFIGTWRPGWKADFAGLGDLLSFGLYLVGNRVGAYAIRHVDNLLVGRFLGTVALGFYSAAYRYVQLPVQAVQQSLNKVLFAVLSRIRDPREAGRAYLEIVRVIALLAAMPMLGLAVLADEAVFVLYGRQWDRIVPLVRLFAVLGYFQTVTSTTGWLFTSRGRADLQFRLMVPAWIYGAICMAIGLRWGIEGVAGGFAFASVTAVWLITVPLGLVGLRMRDFLAAFRTVALAAAVATAAMVTAYVLLPDTGHDIIVPLAVVPPVGLAVYAALMWTLDRALVRSTATTVRSMLRRGPAPLAPEPGPGLP